MKLIHGPVSGHTKANCLRACACGLTFVHAVEILKKTLG